MFRPAIFAAAVAMAPSVMAQEKQKLSQATMDALVHVVAHEIGHAFLREFDLPIIGPEEAIADDFATVYVHLAIPERAEQIVAARADQSLADGEAAGRFSEYFDDEQRAGRSVCLLYSLDPERYENLVERYDMGDEDATVCRDFGPEVGRAWRRLIDAYRVPYDARITEVRLVADDFPLAQTIVDSESIRAIHPAEGVVPKTRAHRVTAASAHRRRSAPCLCDARPSRRPRVGRSAPRSALRVG